MWAFLRSLLLPKILLIWMPPFVAVSVEKLIGYVKTKLLGLSQGSLHVCCKQLKVYVFLRPVNVLLNPFRSIFCLLIPVNAETC
jgi:hypothetical protein